MITHSSGIPASSPYEFRRRLTTIVVLTLLTIACCAARSDTTAGTLDTLTQSDNGEGIWRSAVGGGFYTYVESAADTFSDPLYRQFILLLSHEYHVKGWNSSFPFEAQYWMWRDGPGHKSTLLLSANWRVHLTFSRFSVYAQVGIGTGFGLPIAPVAFPYAAGIDYRLTEKAELGIQFRRSAYTEPGDGTYYLLVLRISP